MSMSQLKIPLAFYTASSAGYATSCTVQPSLRCNAGLFVHPNIFYRLRNTLSITQFCGHSKTFCGHSRKFCGCSRKFCGSGSLLSGHCSLGLGLMGASQMDCSKKVGGHWGICSTNSQSLMSFAGITIPMLSPQDEMVYDILISGLTAVVALACLRFWDEMAKRSVFDQKLNRKFVHISIGLVFMLFWPLFSSGPQAPYLAALAPGVNIFRMIGLGLGILKNEAMVKSMSRYGDARELLKGPLYYACTLTFITILLWRNSPIAPVAIANLCAGDGFADIAGRRLGTAKLPYNKNKSFAGSFAMLIMGFAVSVGYLHYFSSFGYYEVSSKMILATFVVSIAATIVESLPISTQLEDNLTVSIISVLVGCLVL